jgi:hypothetical protein
MAAVSISVGGIAIDLGDEDRSAKYLTRLAKATIADLVDFLGENGSEVEEGKDG